jgi:predicted regulator of Ras-like GTPase activity (Roadblock/LC7/MglB family)
MTKRKKDTQMENEATGPIAVQVTVSESDLRAKLDEIKGHDGVIGYILRNSHSAAVDLKDPTKIIEYAALSSSTLDAGEELADLFNLGNIKSIVVEGKNIKMLSMIIDENRISIFMEKNGDAEAVRKALCTKVPSQ